jgi:hypothetical protein
MNQSNMSDTLNNTQLADDIWAMFDTTSPKTLAAAPPNNGLNAEQPQNAENIAPEIEDLILTKLGEKKERAAVHLGISAAEVETMPFDLSALEQEGIFLNVDATGFSVLSRQLDWRSLGIELPAEQAVRLSPPRAGLLPDKYRKSLQRGAAQAHNALNKYSFRFALCETVLGSSEYKWIPFTAFEAFEKEYAAALETLSRAKAEVIENYDEILNTLRETFKVLAKDSADRLEATQKEPINREEFIAATIARAMQMIPTVAMIRDGMRIEMKPKVILLGSEMRAESVRVAKLELETASIRRAQTELEIEVQVAKNIAEIKVKTFSDEQKREQELKERIRQIKIEAVKQEFESSVSPLKEGLEQLRNTIYEAATEMAKKLGDSKKFIPGGMAKRAREMYRWFKLMNFTGDTEIENVLKELSVIASRDAKTRTAEEMKDALGAVIVATSKRARKLLKTERLDALEL